MRAYHFTKMQGAGNDFVVFDGREPLPPLDADVLRHIANRHFGVGCDQILVLTPPSQPGAAPGYRIFNADGGEVGQCGNGARCLVRYAIETGLVTGPKVSLISPAGKLDARLREDGLIEVDMGPPQLDPDAIPFQAQAQDTSYPLDVGKLNFDIGAVSMGNPHAVLVVDDVDAAPVDRLGPAISGHTRFAEGANVGFMQILAPDRIALRVFERGAGETLACGTGACAAVVWGRLSGCLGAEVGVDLPGGSLVVHWSGVPGATVRMAGPAERVFEGKIEI